MVSPSVMFIEIAADNMKDRPDWLVKSQQNELTSFGDVRAQKIGASGLSDDFRKGYELGLQVARIYLKGNPAAVMAKVDF